MSSAAGGGAAQEETAIDPVKFFKRLDYIKNCWQSKKASWGNSDVLCFLYGASSEDIIYSKSISIHLFLFGYELTNSISIITTNEFYFMGSKNACALLQAVFTSKPDASTKLVLIQKEKDDVKNRENFQYLANAIRKSGSKVGSIFKAEYPGTFVKSWIDLIESALLEKVEITSAVSLMLAAKDPEEVDFSRKAAILSNKVMKHGFVAKMETIVDEDSLIPHSNLCRDVESIVTDPSKIDIKVQKGFVDSCFSPIIQSGGKYDIRVSAQSDDSHLKPDIVICSLGAKYRNYCANISRTFLFDPPPKVDSTYKLLTKVHAKCLDAMKAGQEMKTVYAEAVAFVQETAPDLVQYLPKSFGFCMGIEFRDSSLLLNATNANLFVPNMIFNLSVGFQGIPLSEDDKANQSKVYADMTTFSLLIADTVCILSEGFPDTLTKLSIEDVYYNIGDKDEKNEEPERKFGDFNGQFEERRSGRLANSGQSVLESSYIREAKQKELMEKAIAEGKRRVRLGLKSDSNEKSLAEAVDLNVFRSSKDFSSEASPNKVVLDARNEVLFVPVMGQPVPFHVSLIKSVVYTAGDPESYLRINFLTSGMAIGKDVNPNTKLLIEKYAGTLGFIKEMTFRSRSRREMEKINADFTELKKKMRQRDQQAEEERNIVSQSKLIKIRDPANRNPRLQDVSMKPTISVKKCIGNLEAHQNGLRFTSTKGETLDVMYENVKHCIFQPCINITTVLIHFHLKDPIMIGKKKQKDVQFYTDVVESSLNLEGSRRSYGDADELGEEQREREKRRKLNIAFRDFCKKVSQLAEYYKFSLPIETPDKDIVFTGSHAREIVTIQPTAKCLVNVSEFPPFVVPLVDIEHVHFERVTFGSKHFDMQIIMKDWSQPVKKISMVDIKLKDLIQEWLTAVKITYTQGKETFGWEAILKAAIAERDVWYETVDADGEPRVQEPGWSWLNPAEESEEEDEEESSYESDEDSDESSDDDDDDESDFDEDEDGSDDDEDDDEDEEEEEEEEDSEEERRKRKSQKSKEVASKKSRY
jgi:nucleosome binding factor SPN SPT16 subunit